MIVECPRCRARYRVEAGLLERDQTFKCSRCSHIFAYEAEGVGSEPAAGELTSAAPLIPAAPLKTDPNKPDARPNIHSMSFSFSRSEDPESGVAADEPQTSPESPARPAPFVPAAGKESDFSFADDDDEPIEEEPRFVRGEDELRIQAEEAHNPTRSYLAFLGVLVIVYAIFTLDLLNHPARAEKLLAGVPVVGEVLAQDHLLQIKVQLQDVEGAYQQIKDDRTVFIVSGRAVNTSREPLKGVQIESALIDGAGRPVETKSIYCGNAMSLKIVKDLSSKEISLLQRLEPPKRFEIRPGESAGFSVVFLTPPPSLKEFTTRVVSAQSSMS